MGLLDAFAHRGLKVQPFKVGPDSDRPGIITRAVGRVSCRNLDRWMVPRHNNLAVFTATARGADVAVVEGVMGLFDGYDGASEAGSTAQMAKWLGLPVLLVVDARAMARSAAALVHGFASFDPALSLAGVVFNRVGSPRHLEYLAAGPDVASRRAVLWRPPSGPGTGHSRAAPGPGDRRGPSPDEAYLGRLADRLETHLDLPGLLANLPQLALPEEPALAASPAVVRLGVARDRAFCFYYPENLELLASFGAELVPFSPLADQELPAGLDGIYLGGGYPELYAGQLAANEALRQALKAGAAGGLPIYAECGGLMYLSREIRYLEDRVHPMAGVFPFTVRMLPRLKALGYREVTLAADSLLGPAGTTAGGTSSTTRKSSVNPSGYPASTASPPGGVGRGGERRLWRQ